MKSHLYLPESTSNYLKLRISSYVDIFFEKLLPVFKNIEKEAEEHASFVFEDYTKNYSPDWGIDIADISEKSFFKGLEYYSQIKLGEYNLISTWHVTLYQLWEQQVRLFLFKELSHTHKLEFKDFCTNIDGVKNTFKEHNLNLEDLQCWSKINELRVLCNVIKHGPGDSAEKLKIINPKLFKQGQNFIHIEVHNSTLIDETLDISGNTLKEYTEALLTFWDEIPERSHSKEK
jgi:hypothetical protein